jgi:IS30 family transposase
LEDNASEKKHAVGSKVGISKLTEEQVLKIRELKQKGYGIRELGRMYGVNHKTISAIIKNKTWKHI